MKRNLLLIIFLLSNTFGKAYSIFGGEITYQRISNLTFNFYLSLYINGTTDGWDTLLLDYGDGIKDTVFKSNEILVDPNHQTSKLNFNGMHTYSALGTYVISFFVSNRPADVMNINGGNSVNEPFYIEDSLFIRDSYLFPFDYSPSYLHDQTEIFYDGISLTHISSLSDTAADSVTYQLITPLKNSSILVANYALPNQIPGTPFGETFIIDDTGVVVWISPVFSGKYCIAIKATLWKFGMRMGTIERDMLINFDGISFTDEAEQNFSFTVFPNPVSDALKFFVNPFSPNNLSAKLYNSFGEIISQQENVQPSVVYSFDVSRLPSGIYFLKLSCDESNSRRMIIVNR